MTDIRDLDWSTAVIKDKSGKTVSQPQAAPELQGVDWSNAVITPPPTLTGDFSKGLSSGTDNLQSAGYGAIAAGMESIGATGARDWAEAGMKRNNEEAAQNAPSVTSLDDVHGTGDFAHWLAGGAGQLAPSLAQSVITQLGGRKLGLKTGINQNAAGFATSMAGNTAVQTGSIYSDILEKTGQRDPGKALGYGLATAAMDTVSELPVMKALDTPSAGGLAHRMITGFAKQAPIEGLTEGLQTIGERAAVLDADPTGQQKIFSPEGVSEIRDAAALGLAGGGMVGAASHGLSPQSDDNPPPPPPPPSGSELPPEPIAPEPAPIVPPPAPIADDPVLPPDFVGTAEDFSNARSHVEQKVAEAAAVDPNNGVLSRVVNMGAQNGAVANKAAEEATAAVAEQQAQEDKKPQASEVDVTPAQRDYTDEDLVGLIKTQLAAGNQVWSPQMAKDLGVEPSRAFAARALAKQQLEAEMNPDMFGTITDEGTIQQPIEAVAPEPVVEAAPVTPEVENTSFPSFPAANKALIQQGLKGTHAPWADGKGGYVIKPIEDTTNEKLQTGQQSAAIPEGGSEASTQVLTKGFQSDTPSAAQGQEAKAPAGDVQVSDELNAELVAKHDRAGKSYEPYGINAMREEIFRSSDGLLQIRKEGKVVATKFGPQPNERYEPVAQNQDEAAQKTSADAYKDNDKSFWDGEYKKHSLEYKTVGKTIVPSSSVTGAVLDNKGYRIAAITPEGKRHALNFKTEADAKKFLALQPDGVVVDDTQPKAETAETKADPIEIVSEKGMRVDASLEQIQAILGDKVKVPAHKKGGFLMSRKYEQKLREGLAEKAQEETKQPAFDPATASDHAGANQRLAEKQAEAPAYNKEAHRAEQINTILQNGGKVVNGELRMQNGMGMYQLTDEELASVPDDKKDTSDAISKRLEAVYGKKSPEAADKQQDGAPSLAELQSMHLETVNKLRGQDAQDDRLLSKKRMLEEAIKEKEAEGQNDELDAEMQSYERKAEAQEAAPETAAKNQADPADALVAASEKELESAKKKAKKLNSGLMTVKHDNLKDRVEAQQQAKAAERVLQQRRSRIFDVEDAVRNSVRDGNLDAFTPDLQSLFPKSYKATQESIGSQDQATKQSNDAQVESQDETAKLDQPSTGTLAGAPAEPVSGIDGEREAGGGADGSRRTDSRRNKRPDESGNGLEPSMGDDAGAVPVSGGRGKRGRGGDAGQRDIFAAEPVAPHEGQSVAAHASDPVFDYRITDDTALGEGGKKTKYKGNIAAIKLLRELEESGRHATPDEQNVLARYVGWGGLTEAFDAQNKDWSKEHAELRELLDDEEYATARQSTQYAHYTSKEIIGAIYDAVKHIGFSGGKILEPGMGVGNFLGLMPDDLRGNSRFTGVERERIAGGIAKNLYPNQNIQQADFTEWAGQKGFFDLAIGNPPFAATTLNDKAGDKHLSGLSVHNYFFAKSVDQLREGGVLAMVVSNSFMDARRDTARKYIADRTKLLGAIRLPNNAFSKNAMTEVTTDIIFLQKLPEAQWGSKETRAAAQDWLDSSSILNPGTTDQIPLNQYFIDNPEMMLGKMTLQGTMYRADSPALVAREGQNTADLMAKAIQKLPKDVYASVETLTQAQSDKLLERMSNIDVEVGGFFMRDGALYQREEDVAGEQLAEKLTANSQWTAKTVLGIKRYNQLKTLYEMRTTLRQLIAAEMNNDTVAMDAMRKSLNTIYDGYAKEYGLINSAPTVSVYGEDPDFPLLSSLEHNYDKGIGEAEAKRAGIKKVAPSAKKAPIFSRAVVDARKQVNKASTPLDALLVSLAERGTIDVGYVGELLKTDGHKALESLTEGENPELFIDPASGGYVLRDKYLSGNVRKKLKEAKARRAEANVAALEKVLPKDKEPGRISGNIGAPWVAESIYEDFAKHLFGGRASVNYSAVAGSFSADFFPDNDVANSNTYGIPEYPAAKIIDSLLNHRVIRVGHYDSEGKFHLDSEKTQAANDKAREIKDAFQDWMFADSDRAERLVRDFNDANNNYVKRQFDGKLLTFPGKVPDSIIKHRRHQRNAVWRIVQDRTALLDHVVGSGKTFTVVSSVMELKRMGLARKPMVAVPNHLVKQWAADFYRLYPGANILAITKKDFSKNNRRKFLAKITTGDWDAVIISHSSFGFIKPDADFEMNLLDSEIAGILEAIEDAKRDEGKKATVKQLEKMREKLQNRVAALRDKPMDDLLDFAQLGVDQLFVDEAHLFKNLMFSTKMQNVRGLGDPKGSQRALDLFIKAQQLYNKNGNGQGVVFATGTPVSNSLAEMYHMMRYLQPQELKDAGLWNFDAWADTFAETDQVWMQSPSGSGYKSSNRMVKFVNANSLLQIFDQIADTVTMDDIKSAYKEETGKEFPLPKLKGGKRQPVSIPLSGEQKEYMGEIEKRAQEVEKRKGPPKKGEDNILSIMSDARKMAMDIRLVDQSINERPANGRIAVAGQNIFDRYKKYDKVKGTQLVFSDMGTPLKSAAKELKEYNELKARMAPLDDTDLQASAALGDEKAITTIEDAENAAAELEAKGRDWLDGITAALRGFSVYDDMKALLIEKGIPANEIAFIHDYNTDDQKAALYSAMNSGRIRVLLGSTPKLGAGTNVQERLVALHHLDVPWKPSDVEQREGRIIRQGNRLMDEIKDFEVEVLAYATQDTLDLFMWQTQENKLKMIGQLRTGEIDDEIENAFEDISMSAGEMQAAATSNPYMMQEIQLKDLVKRLERKQRSFQAQQSSLAGTVKRAERDLEKLPKKIENYKTLEVAAGDYQQSLADKQQEFSVTINGKQYDNRAEASAQLLALTETEKGQRMEPLEMNGETYTSKASVAEALQDISGDREPVLFTKGKKTFTRRKFIEEAIKADVSKAIDSEEEVVIGRFGNIEVSIEATESRYKKGIYSVGISMSANGATDTVEIDVNPDMLDNGTAQVLRAAEGAIARFGSAVRWAQSDLEKAKKNLADAQKASGGEFAQAKELEDARAKHKEVLGLLKDTGKEKTQEGDEEAKLSRSGTAGSMKPVQVRVIVNSIAAKWKNAPQVIIADTVAELPFKAPSDSAGAFHNGKVYLVANNLRNRDHAEFVLLHEALGHYGLSGVLGNQIKPAMRTIYQQNRSVRDLADKYLKENDGASIDLAVEEALSDLAGTKLQKLNGFQRLVAAVRNAIRALGFKLELSDNDVLYMMGKAREFVEKGTTVTGNQESARFMSGFHEEAPNDISPIGFYSPLARAARNLVQQKGTPEQMLAMLERQKGVKPAEIEATGLKEYLELASRPTPDGVSAVYDYYGDPLAREIAHDAKDGDEKAIKEMAIAMAKLIPEGSTLVPVPSRNGKAEMTLKLAMHIADITGSDIANVLTGNKRESLYDIKKSGGKLNSDQLGISASRSGIKNPVLIDNVFATGATMAAIKKALPDAVMVAFARDTTAMPYKPAIITKQQIVDYLASNGVQVQESMLGAGKEPKLPDGWTVKYDREEDAWIVYDQDGDEMADGTSREDAIEMAMDDDVRADNADLAGDTKFGQYVLPGGKNYRELLLTLPEKTSADDARADYERWAKSAGLSPNASLSEAKYLTETGKTAPAPRTMTAMNADAAKNFKSSHYGQPNILAHVRFNERTDADGKRVLFLEELQSDWAQAGRKQGFKNEAERNSIRSALEKFGVTVDDNTSFESLSKKGVPDDLAGRWYDTFIRGQGHMVPSAPFVTSTDAWVGLSMKRMIAYAAENGFDRIAWTTGEQQADRYKLSKQVNSIDWRESGGGIARSVIITMPDNMQTTLSIDDNGNVMGGEFNGKGLDDVIGKAVAEKIMSEKSGNLSGLALNIGGEGMKSFYNQIVPKVAKEITKKMGGKVGEIAFPAYYQGMKLSAQAKPDMQPGFDITPEMRQTTLKGMPLFSRSGLMGSMQGSDFLDRFRQAADDSDPKTTFAEKLAGGITDLKPSLLGAVPLNYMRDFARNGMSAVGDFIEIKRKMDTMRQKMHNEYDEKAQEWLSWARTDKKAATALSDLMHESTIAGVDPSVPLTSTILDMVNGQEQKQAKRAEYDRLKAKYDALPKEAQSIYKTVRDQYRDQRTLLDKVIMENIQKSADFAEIEAERKYKHAVERVMEDGLDPEEEQDALDALAKKRDKTIGAAKAGAFGRVATLRKIFESSSVEAPYFPLARYGDYFAAVYQDGKIKEVRHFEKSADQMAFVKQQREANYKVKFGRKSNKADVQGAIDPRFVADIDEVLADLPDADELRDEIYQKYLESLPDMSIRKSFIHRKKTSGYNNDALRSYSSKMFHGSYQIARLKYSMEMTDSLNRIDDQAKESSDPVNGMAVANEMRKRHDWVMNPQNSAASQWATTAAFVYYLGMSPAQLFLNASQTVMMGIPVLGSKYGFGKSAAALGNAAAEFAKGKGDVRPMLTGDEKRAMDEFYGLGLIDRTQTFDLAGIGETGSGYSATRTRVMSKIGWFFQKAEVFNREVTAIAAYRLARESGMPHEMAVKDAAERTWNSHFDYTSGNRARFMQNDWARVFLVFRQYSVNMLYRLFRDARDSFKGETPEIKREARRQLGALMGMYGFMAGAAGMPLYGIIMAIGKMFDDDDEDFEQDLKQGIMDMFGETMGRVILNGVPGTLTNTDLTTRIGMGNLWFRNNDKQLEGKDAYFFWMEQLLGAVPAIAANVFTGVNMMMDGNVRRGIETMSPVMARAPLRGARYFMEGGADTTAGDRIADTSGWDSAMQAIGFTPAQVAERYDTNSAFKNAQKRVQDSRHRLLNEFAMATKMQDAESKQKTVKKIKEFNTEYPTLAITGKTLAQSMKAKARRDAMTKDGLYTDKRFIGLRKEMELD